jgi:hypothetical protein
MDRNVRMKKEDPLNSIEPMQPIGRKGARLWLSFPFGPEKIIMIVSQF